MRNKLSIKGISLIEIIVGMALILTCFAFFSTGMKGTLISSVDTRKNEKINEAMDYMENEIRKANYYFVTAADSETKGGSRLTTTSSQGTYFVPWTISKMRPQLEEFERRIKLAGAKRFWIAVSHQYRVLSSATGNDQIRSFYGVGTNSRYDMVQPAFRYTDWAPADSMYFDVKYDSILQKWVSEAPDTGSKLVVIIVSNELGNFDFVMLPPKPLAKRSFQIANGGFGGDTTDSLTDLLEYKARFPDFRTTYFHQRNTPAQRDNLDLPWTKIIQGPLGMADCRELRWDNYIDPVKGDGALVLSGSTTPGSSVYYYFLFSLANVLSPGSPFREIITVPSAGTGEFFYPITTTRSNDLLREMAAYPTHNLYAQVTATYRGVTSSVILHNIPKDHILNGPPPLIATEPSSPVKTRSPIVSAEKSNDFTEWNAPYSTILIDGVPYDTYNIPYHNKLFVSAGSPYDRMPPIFPDNSNHTVEVEALHTSCYKSTTTFSFTIDLGNSGSSDFDNTPPTIYMGGAPGRIRVIITDAESGVDYRTILVWLDGSRLPLDETTGFTMSQLSSDTVSVALGVTPSQVATTGHNLRVQATHYSTTPGATTSRTTTNTYVVP